MRLDRSAGSDSCGPVIITATPLPAGTPRQWAAPSDVDLSAAEEWSITATSRGCWSPVLHARRDAKNLVLPLWPEAALTGRVIVPKGAEPPAMLAVQIESPAVPRSRFDCAVAKSVFRCAVPATTLDVRIAASGFVPRYFFGVDRPNLGEVALARGGSISGMVRFDGDGPPLSGIALELKPVTAPLMKEGWAAEEKRLASRATTLRPNDRGFFQFARLEPGQYTVTARQEGWSRARRTEIEVKDGEENVLEPIVIEPLAEVDVSIRPPLDPYGKPWLVSLREMVPMSSMSTPVVETEASMSGAWSAAGIESGFHRIEVMDHRRSNFAYSMVDISPHMAPVSIGIASVLVRGTIRLGNEPLRARLQFRNGKGTMIAMRSDAEGRFSGALPQEGRWEVLIFGGGSAQSSQQRTVQVQASGGVADIDLRLAGTRVAGRVVGSDGAPVTSFVRLWSEERTFLGATSTDERGQFELAGIEPGAVYVEAESRASENAKSGFIPVTVSEVSSDELTVVLRPAARFRARLTTPSGIPVAGAIVRYLLPDRPGQTMEEVSGPNGVFTIALSPGAPSVDLTILPPGLPVKIVRVPLADRPASTTELILGRPAGILELEVDHRGPFPWIEHEGVRYSVGSLRYPSNWTSPPRDHRPWGMSLLIEAGDYTICGDRAMTDRCVRKTIAPGAIERVDGTALLR
ncbi:MAG TPA: carboxypeptidase-like regulatory domain-containing protein [Thermoanaerobaculia bacterium]